MADVLVVDDSSTMRELVSGFLQKNGFEVIVAIDGRDGLDKVKTTDSLKLILCDINMPNMDGLTMAAKVRTELLNSSVKIIMLTTEDNAALRDQGRTVGVNGWIVKPFRGEAVLPGLKKLCGMS
jgi:two-component system chemotaxis response regulator CheY